MRLSPNLRRGFFYSVPEAGAMEPLRWGRTESYRGVERGDIPVERDGRFLLVPKRPWDAKLKRLRRQLRAAGVKRRVKPTKAATNPVTKAAETAAAHVTTENGRPSTAVRISRGRQVGASGA